ncbi:MAG: hypothetical protein ACE5OY_05585 [Candidatus Bathyarchaeia archaeon]
MSKVRSVLALGALIFLLWIPVAAHAGSEALVITVQLDRDEYRPGHDNRDLHGHEHR